MNNLDVLIRDAAQIYEGGGETFPLETSIGIAGEHIVFIGPVESLSEAGHQVGSRTQVVYAHGQLVTPGLIDPHTHVVFAGDRSGEYAMRAAGRGYLEIARAGGGIKATMRATRAASQDELIEGALPRLARLLEAGVTTAEVKSGYGLNTETELKILRAIKELNHRQPIELVPTFLGAHTLPPEYSERRSDYVRLVIEEMLPAVAREGLAEFCDVFIEEGAFGLEEASMIFEAGKALGLTPKLHADQLSPGHGAELAARVGAISADHLEYISEAGIQAMAQRNVVAVLLPGASLFLGSNDDAPARRIIDAGVTVALATDCNPGTCMTENLQLMLTLGMSRLKMSPEEVLDAVTSGAAKAIGRDGSRGKIELGAQADLAIFNVSSYTHLPYHFGASHTRMVFKKGRQVYGA